MSKFLKFIFYTIMLGALVCVLGMAIPPFFGVTTLIMDAPETQTNLPMGSVTYAIPVKTEEITPGTRILVTEDEKVYRYEVETLDYTEKTGTVIDPTVSDPEVKLVKVQNYIQKVVITIGLVGYLQMATKSMEGIVILSLAVLCLVIIFVIAEIWKKDPDDEEEDDEEEEDEVYVKSEKELRREEKEREKRMKEDDRQLLKEEKARKKQKKSIIKTGGFVDEILEEDEEPDVPAKKVSENSKAQAAASEAHEVLKKEIAATTAEQKKKTKASVPKKKVKSEVSAPAPTKEINAVEVKRRAIPAYTAEQLADKAEKAGEHPDVQRDEVTKVTLFDYSDIIGEEE